MNPLTKVKLINELNEREADLGIKDAVSWHSVYKDSAWVFIGGFPYELTEGDIICVFSQYGEIANINLVRDKKTGKSKGFCFLCYEDQRSTILAVDNLNGIKIKGRTIRVDHVANYRPPKDTDDIDDITKQLREEGCAPKVPVKPSSESESEEEHPVPVKKPKKDKKEKKKKKEKKEKKKALKEERHETRTETSTSSPPRVKREKEDVAYEKYVVRGPTEHRRDRPGHDREMEADRFRERHRDDRRNERDRDRQMSERDRDRQTNERDRQMSERDQDRQTNERDRQMSERDRDRQTNERDRQMSERDRDRQTDRNREEKRHDDTRQRDNRDRGRGSDRERERDGGREKERERDRERDKGFAKHRDHSWEIEHRRN